MSLKSLTHSSRRWLLSTAAAIAMSASLLSSSLFAQEASRGLPFDGPFIIERDGYTVCYDGRTRIPYWVYEYVTEDDLSGPGRRKDNYREDPELPRHVRSTKADYRRSGYSRGHLAPAQNHKDSQRNMDETFFLSNMAPQTHHRFNGGGGGWYELEAWCHDLVDHDTSIHIISGPLFLAEGPEGSRIVQYPVIGDNDVAVATHFYKIVITEDADGSRDYYGFIVPHRPFNRSETFWDHSKGIDNVLSVVGLDLADWIKPSLHSN